MLKHLVCALLLAGCASGTTLVTGTERAPTSPESVQVYLEAPANYEVLGSVQSTSRLGASAQSNLDRAVADVKARAAAIGANGVLIDYQGAPGGASPLVGVNTGGVQTLAPVSDGSDREVRARAILVR